jgi:hypothetical protein
METVSRHSTRRFVAATATQIADANSTPRQPVVRGLAWFSVALGVAELFVSGAVARATGLGANKGIVRLYGLRELGCGLGMLVSKDPVPFLKMRIAGDMLDLGTAAVAASRYHNRRRALTSALSVAAITALDIRAARACTGSTGEQSAQPGALRDYSGRSGFPRGVEAMRGAARNDSQPTASVD